MMYGYPGGLGWVGWLLMTVSMVAFWGLVVLAVLAVVRGTRPGDATRRTEPDPQAVLDQRFARGEIDAEEYRARSDVLRTRV